MINDENTKSASSELNDRVITEQMITDYRNYLYSAEKAYATSDKYIRDLICFQKWLDGSAVSKGKVLQYKRKLTEEYATTSVNTVLSSINGFFTWVGWIDLKVKNLKIQRKVFCSESRELSKEEYLKLLETAYNYRNKRLYYLLQTICSTGIRVSELEYITVESLKDAKAEVNNKGKIRPVLLPDLLCQILLDYCQLYKIKSGPVFVTRNGKPLNRTNIWYEMKKLCQRAGVPETKVFPHNLRHLFARTYYDKEKDIVRLADLLGHSSINTTRTYTIENGDEHRRQIQSLGLVDDKNDKKSTT